MDQTCGNEKLLLFQCAVQRFEEYERAVCDNAQPNDILQYQYDCLNLINEIVQSENCDPYFMGVLYIRENLLRNIQKIESCKSQITINDLTITLTNNQSSEPILPTLSKILSTVKSKSEPVIKKPKIDSEDNDQTQKLRNTIKNTLVVPQSTGLGEIAGLKEAKILLQEAIVYPIKFPQLFNGGRKKWNKALLYGLPGTGKTQLVHCLAAEINVPLYCISNSDLWSSFVGESEKLIKMLFQYCQETEGQCLIFIDEIDSICRARNSKEAEHERRFKNQLLTQLSEMDRNPNNTIFFLACTNLPWDLDTAFVRRFQRRIYIPLPDRDARLQIFKIQSKSADLFNSEQWDQILELTEGWSGSDITDLVNFAMFQPIKELQTADQWILTKNKYYMPAKENKHSTLKLNINQLPANRITVRPVELNDFFVALQNVTKTVSETSLKKFEDFNMSFQSSLMVNKNNN